ncbi:MULTISPECIES: DUF3147 family protein [Acetobacter]|uniref:DUF3147 family protein n=2 Tax=Acetobacter TaxID=434 RepID=A0A5B9GEK4_9PROT|nr:MULTISPECIES: DUF3147 family protein [Acetobacter]NLG91585.1 DUF3147 family protein [Acetobacter sp.]GBR56362.1 hypothetical protein AA18889_0603 [Acetobacter senegalensis DSM 18889]AKR48478.1 hypothetical protein DB34_05715 [Acetobacter pasteurianus]ARW47894.1 hypothetical protein S1001342_01568 [Acetobacter pasteurianus subsp. pasteurianus]MCP1202757.1 DUF3147 family protein [Acetobacter oryzoeni]
MFFLLKTLLSALIIALVSTLARRYPGFGALVAALPLVSVFGMIWLWLETHDPARMEAHVSATFWYVLPSLPMFLFMPWLMRCGVHFWPALASGCGLTVVLYLLMIWAGPWLGISQ